MRVSAKSDYALRALIEMAGRTDGAPVSAEELGRLQGIPHGFLQAILADLRRSGVVVSQRGQSGGWRLNREPDDISVADVIRAVEGPLAAIRGEPPEDVHFAGSAEPLGRLWIAVRANLRGVLENVSLADLADGKLPARIDKLADDPEAWVTR